MLAQRFGDNFQFAFGVVPVIQTGVVLDDVSPEYVWRRAENRAAKTFSINLFLGEHLYVGSWFQCLVYVLKHILLPSPVTQDAHDLPRYVSCS